ncbi:unnamed protein product, partial [Vitis vinifera]|uniref:Uncharacterized protein n=1 Tax=Vitis vinifera TaxID=29760 RepID=D7U7B5_VITVI
MWVHLSISYLWLEVDFVSRVCWGGHGRVKRTLIHRTQKSF